MHKLWLVLSAVSICLGTALYLYQEDVRHAHWSWSQLFTTETATFAALCVGIALFMVAIIEFIWQKYQLSKSYIQKESGK